MAELGESKIYKNFISYHLDYRAEIRRLTENTFPNIVSLRDRIIRAIEDRLKSVQDKEFAIEDKSIFLFAQFFMGIELSYAAIVEGLYPQAANLQKQQIETLTALEEIKEGRRKEGKTPIVQHSLPEFKKTYYNLNKIAHPANSQLIQVLNGYKDSRESGPTLVPQLNKKACGMLLPNHCVCLFKYWGFLVNHFEVLVGIEVLQQEMQDLLAAIAQMRNAST